MRSSKQVLKAIGMTLAVVLCAVLIVGTVVEMYFTHTAYYYQDAEVRQAMAGTLDTLISGASHGYEGIEPVILDEALGTSGYNLSCSMMTMHGRYEMLKKELSRNPVKTVILEVSYNTITRNRRAEGPEGDIYQLGRLDTLGERISFFFSSFYLSEYDDVLLDLADRGKRTCYLMGSGSIEAPVQWETRGFLPNETAEDLTVTGEELDRIYHTNSLNPTANPENVEIFHELMEMLEEREIRVILVVTPVSDQFLLKQDNLQEVMDWYRQAAEDYGCEYYDFNLIRDRGGRYPQDTAFYDTEHLSESAADTFSRQLAQVIAMADGGEDVSKLFYDNYTQAEEAVIARIRSGQ